MIQLTTSFMFVENVKQVVKHALMILLALHLIIGHLGNLILILHTRNPASRASKHARLVAMYIAVAIRLSGYVHRVTSEVAVSFLPEVIAQI